MPGEGGSPKPLLPPTSQAGIKCLYKDAVRVFDLQNRKRQPLDANDLSRWIAREP